MKKTTVIIITLALLLALSACNVQTGGRAVNGTDKAQYPSDETTLTAHNESEAAPETEANTVSAQISLKETKPPEETEKQANELITRDRAIEIALQAAGITRDSAYDLEAELDRERHGTYWEVDFETREKEYSYEINAATGEIIRKELERND